LTTKIITEILENHSENFLCGRIAVINLFQANIDKQWHYLCSYEKAPPYPLLSFWNDKGSMPPSLASLLIVISDDERFAEDNTPVHLYEYGLNWNWM